MESKKRLNNLVLERAARRKGLKVRATEQKHILIPSEHYFGPSVKLFKIPDESDWLCLVK